MVPQSRPKEIGRRHGGLAKVDVVDDGLTGKLILLRKVPVRVKQTLHGLGEVQLGCRQNAVVVDRGGGGGGRWG